MTLTIALIAHGNESMLRHGLEQLAAQTRQPDEILLMTSDVPEIAPNPAPWPWRQIQRPNMNDHGHDKRTRAAFEANSEWIAWWDADNRYSDRWIERMMDMPADADLVYCMFDGKHGRRGDRIEVCHVDMNNVIVRTEIARLLLAPESFNSWRSKVLGSQIDGQFVVEAAAKSRTAHHVPEILVTYV